MKKHRRFLIFYSLYLGGIFLLFMAFDTTKDNNIAPMNESDAICKLTTKCAKNSARSKCDKSSVVY